MPAYPGEHRIVKEQRQTTIWPTTRTTNPIQLASNNYAKKPSFAKLRWAINALTGKYFQQHTPILNQTVPVGHSVRFAYLETAIALIQRLTGDTYFASTTKESLGTYGDPTDVHYWWHRVFTGIGGFRSRL